MSCSCPYSGPCRGPSQLALSQPAPSLAIPTVPPTSWTGNGLLYALVIGHAVFSIGCVISVRNGDGAFRDGMVMKEAFVIFWFCLIIAFIMGQLGASDPFYFV